MAPKGIRKLLAGFASGKKKSSNSKAPPLEAESRAPDQGTVSARDLVLVTSAGAAAPPPASLNLKQQLEACYARLLTNKGAQEAWSKEFFQTARILVLGRSGAGKTTLIRLMVGKDGPESIAEGVVGVQDIEKEFLYVSSEEHGVPLIIHDSNGVDVKGQARVNEIKAFLDKHQRAVDFSEHIHIVWYVLSAIDPRCVDDADVMKMIKEYKIPMLLIMTHADYGAKIKVTDVVLDKLLQTGYSDAGEREAAKKMMVRVGNDGVSLGTNNELIIDESKRDREGLKMVAKRTQQLMDKKLRYTWIAAQAVDMDAKLDESAGVVAGYATRALLTSLPRAIPFADPIKLSILFCRIMVVMCQIWGVPQELKKALVETLLQKEASVRVLHRFSEDMVFVAGLAASIAATVVTAGAAFPAIIAVFVASGILNVGKAIPILVKTFSLQVLGTILYVKSTQAGTSKQQWRGGVSREEYLKQCEEFALKESYQALLVGFAKREHSTLDTALRPAKVRASMKRNIGDMFHQLLKDRPSSLFSRLQKDKALDDQPSSHPPLAICETTNLFSIEFDYLLDQVLDNISIDENGESISSEGEDENDNKQMLPYDNIF